MRVLFAICIIAVFFVFKIQGANAASDHLVINEIYPSPISDCDQEAEPDCQKEWVELYNPTDENVDLKNYRLKDGAYLPKTIADDSLILLPNEYYTFEVSGSWLNGDANGDIVFLLRDDIIIDKIAYSGWDKPVLASNIDFSPEDNAILPSKGQSISRIPNGIDTDNDKSDFRSVAFTKGGQNILPPPVVYSDLMVISEIFPDPIDEDYEFIELLNTSDAEVDLSDWLLDDSTAGSGYKIPKDTIVKAGEYRCFYKLVSGIALNNTSKDSANLFDPDGKVKFTITYDKAQEGESYSLFGDEWEWTSITTPGTENRKVIIQRESQNLLAGLVDIASARSKQNEVETTIQGTVTVTPGTLSKQYFYIEDVTSGIQIYSYYGDFPTLSLGDIVRVKGELTEMAKERRIKISSPADVTIIQSGKPSEPNHITIEEIGEEYEGEYVKVRGIVSKTSGSTFYIYGSGEVQVVIRETTNIYKPKMRKGDKVEISGIVSQYKDHYRILPTRQSDVIVLSSGALPKAGPNIFNLEYLILNIILWKLFHIQRKRLGNSPQNMQMS